MSGGGNMISNSNLLEIISPYPFSNYYGINDEVYRMQRAIEKILMLLNIVP